jgi:hypothetical protein
LKENSVQQFVTTIKIDPDRGWLFPENAAQLDGNGEVVVFLPPTAAYQSGLYPVMLPTKSMGAYSYSRPGVLTASSQLQQFAPEGYSAAYRYAVDGETITDPSGQQWKATSSNWNPVAA